MRLSELLGRDVHDRTGAYVGGVADVILVQDGPLLAEHAAAFRVAGLIVVEHEHTRLLGYERDVNPALFRIAVRRLAGEVYNVPWGQVEHVSDEAVTLTVDRESLNAHDRSLRA